MCVDNDNREQDQDPTGTQSESTRLHPPPLPTKLKIYLPANLLHLRSEPLLAAPANDTHDNAIVACNLK